MKLKKFLITLLTVLMIVTCGTVNVFAKQVDLTIVPNGGSFKDKNNKDVTTIKFDDAKKVSEITLKDVTATKDGYSFGGFVDKDGSGDTFIKNLADKKIYANWIQLIEITLDGNGGTYKDSKTSIKVYANKDGNLGDEVLKAKDPYAVSKANSYFAGYRDANGADVTNTTAFTESTTIVAQWVPDTVVLKNYYAISDGSATRYAKDNKFYVAKPTNPNVSGYRFDGWYKDSEFNTAIADNDWKKIDIPGTGKIDAYEIGTAEAIYAKMTSLVVPIDKPTANTSTFTYTGSEQTYEPTGFDSSTMEISGNKQTNANTEGYTVSVTPKDGYEWKDGTTTEVTFNWVINKADPTYYYLPSAKIVGTDEEGNIIPISYNRKAQTLVNGGFTSDGTYMYALGVGEDGSESPELNTYKDSLDNIVGTNPDDYYVFYYLKGDDNHNDTTPTSIKVTISKKTYKKSPLRVVGTYTYNGKDQTPKLEAMYGSLLTDVDYDIVFGEDVNHTDAGNSIPFKAVLKGNFEGTFDLEFNIEKKKLDATWPTNVDRVYSGLAYAPEATVDTGIDGEEVVLVYSYQIQGLIGGGKLDVKPINAGKYVSGVSLDRDADVNKNYKLNSATLTKNYEITKKELKIAWDYTTPYTYDGKAHAPIPSIDSTTLPVGDEKVELDVEVYKTEKVDKAVNVDEYNAKALLKDNAVNKNYTLDSSTTTKEFKIVPKALQGHWDYLSFENDGQPHNPNYVFDNVVEGDTVNATLSGDTQMTGVGVYSISASLANTYKNYSFTPVEAVYYILDDVNGKIASGVFIENSRDIEDASMTEITASDVSKFNNEELSMALTKNANIRIYTIIENILDNTVFEDMKLNEDNSVLFDVTLYSQIENSLPVQLHNTNDYKISITIKVSEDELTKRGIIGNNKEYFVYAAHEDGKDITYEKLPVYKVTKNEDGTYSFTFSSNKFSSFSLYSTEKVTPKPSKKKYVSPKTSIN